MPDVDLPSSNEEAEERFQRFAYVDPFPDIPPALLNSADIVDYVAATGMLYPFYPDPAEKYLKPASYEVRLGGEYIYWDEAGIKRNDEIKTGDEFILEANSIAFVTLEPMFRIPAYIAVRFNLRITHIYKGLLLGTGPLVDPGFHGRLSIPLHNLTLNDYTLVGGQGLIWMEFTKLSPASRVRKARRPPARRGAFVEFEPDKRDLTLSEYLRKADPNRSVRSSIPDAIETSRRAAEAAASDAAIAAQNAGAAARRLRNLGVGAALVLVVAVAALVLQILSLVNDVNTRIDDLERRVPTAPSPSSTVPQPTVPSPAPATTRRP